MSVVFPPPPMIAVTPGWISSAFCSFTEHTSLFSVNCHCYISIAFARFRVKNIGILLTMANTAW